MKIFLLSLFFLLMTATHKSIGQNVNKDILIKWEELKVSLKTKAKTTQDFANGYIENKKENIGLVKRLNLLAKTLDISLFRKVNFGTEIVKNISQNNENLTVALSQLFVLMEADNDSSFIGIRLNFLTIMEGIENKYVLAKRNYTEACVLHKRYDLIVPLKTKSKKIIVQF